MRDGERVTEREEVKGQRRRVRERADGETGKEWGTEKVTG